MFYRYWRRFSAVLTEKTSQLGLHVDSAVISVTFIFYHLRHRRGHAARHAAQAPSSDICRVIWTTDDISVTLAAVSAAAAADLTWTKRTAHAHKHLCNHSQQS